ncbi:MAG TPA: cysteine hydrolase [Acidimicrobiia bacterium]|jgi:nicotinamidase-related amidase
MPRPLPVELVDPARSALVTQECQNGVIGAQSHLPALAEEARREAIPNIVRLLDAARTAGVTVVHCTIQSRPDGRGSNHNAPIFRLGGGEGSPMTDGSTAAAVIPELGPADTDLVLCRWRGIGPMGGTELDAVLRNLGATTIVGVGVSVNVAMTNFAMDAVNAGYDFVLPRDAVAGIPREYADAVIKNTLSLLSTITTTDDLVAAWSRGA